MEMKKLWSRVGRWFKRPGAAGLPAESVDRPTSLDTVRMPSDGTGTHQEAAHPSPSPDSFNSGPVAIPKGSRSIGLFRRSKINPELERLEAQYARVGNLMDAIEGHMESQADRSERIACSLDSLAQSLTGVPEAFRNQLDVLSNIRESVSDEQARSRRIEESLSQWPRVADAQRETMVSISRQLDESREANAGTTSAVQQCRDAFVKVEETAGASTRALERYTGETRAAAERMAMLLEEQAGRFRLFAWAAIGLAAVAAVIAVISLLR